MAPVLQGGDTWHQFSADRGFHRYKSRAYRARAVRTPRAVLAEFTGAPLPDDIQLRVHDSTR